MKRLLLFSHYNKYDSLSEHVVVLLKKLNKYYDKVVFVSNSNLSDNDQKRLDGLQNKIIVRPNEGYDFSAWSQGMLDIGWDELVSYDSITIMNDTCFGPVYSMDSIFEQMEDKKVDFWGLVSHQKVSASASHNGNKIPEHLQSFFITFNKNVVSSEVFQDFWGHIIAYDNVQDVISNYEIKLTQLLSKTGFRYSAFFDGAKNATDSVLNQTIFLPERCLKLGLPLVKIKAFTHHRYPRYLIDEIGELSDYPIEIIEDYFNEYFDPNQQLVMFDKTIDVTHETEGKKLKVGIHLHAFYMDIAEEFVRRFKKWPFEFDLFITVSNEELKSEITEILIRHNITPKKIIILPNHGRNVIPWTVIASKYLNSYDLAAHFHTKKDVHMHEWVGEVWTEDLMKMLVDPARAIVSNFATNKKLGIVIPDVPTHARYLGAEMYFNNNELKGFVESVYGRMHFDSKRIIDIDKLLAYIYPYGMMYWYRPAALKPASELVFSKSEVPRGKLPDTTVLHALERLLVYVAWGSGYDYRIVKSQEYTSEFVTTLAVNNQVYIKEQSTHPTFVGVKVLAKRKTKSLLQDVAKKMPDPVRAQLLRIYLTTKNKKAVARRMDPTIKLFTHEISNTGGPRVAIDLFTQLRNDPTIKAWTTPELYTPADAKHDKDLCNELNDKNIRVNDFQNGTLHFNKGDIVIMNTIAYGETTFIVILDHLEKGIIEHVYLYPHEYTVSSYLSNRVTNKIIKLLKQKKLTIYNSAIQTQQVYQEYFSEVDEIKLMPNRIDIDKNKLFARDEDDFEKIKFVITGSPDARKGELEVVYAFTSFLNNYYKGNESKYRDFSLTIVGLTEDPAYVESKLYSDRVRVAAVGLSERVVLYNHQPEHRTLDIIKENNLTVLYSLYECLPRVVFDGMAFGHPLLRNDCSGYEEQLVDGVNGWKTSSEDWQGLVSSIEEILNKSKTSNSKLASMSKESVKIAKKFADAKYIIIDDIKNLIDVDK